VSQATRALAHAFDTGALAARRAFFLRAEDPPFAEIDAEQSFRPAYLRLKQAEIDRFELEVSDWEQREYFSLF